MDEVKRRVIHPVYNISVQRVDCMGIKETVLITYALSGVKESYLKCFFSSLIEMLLAV